MQGTGPQEILDHAAVPRGFLYHHFRGGKPELVLAALEFEAARVSDQLAVLLAATPEPAAPV
jgi:TetR/AcrR family transcriptional repressor of lmrAB and yxaGH operons